MLFCFDLIKIRYYDFSGVGFVTYDVILCNSVLHKIQKSTETLTLCTKYIKDIKIDKLYCKTLRTKSDHLDIPL